MVIWRWCGVSERSQQAPGKMSMIFLTPNATRRFRRLSCVCHFPDLLLLRGPGNIITFRLVRCLCRLTSPCGLHYAVHFTPLFSYILSKCPLCFLIIIAVSTSANNWLNSWLILIIPLFSYRSVDRLQHPWNNNFSEVVLVNRVAKTKYAFVKTTPQKGAIGLLNFK